jgi:beta-ribofuranosylaminobenzene 5'-phosphate synthase
VRPDSVTVETPARLHFGLLDLRGSSGRRFGGIGAPAPGMTVRVTVERSRTIEAEGDDASRASEFARRFVAHHGIDGGARITVDRAIPSHAGLGSGTQLALAIARAMAEIYGIDASAPALARSVGRARRSAVGTWTFAGGGFVVEGGHRVDDMDATPPLITRKQFPEQWRCIVAIPDATPGVSGEAEARAFATLPAPGVGDLDRVATLVLLRMLPALAEDDIAAFGAALTEVQEINGRWFASAQGGMFAPGPSATVIEHLRAWGAAGVGQSSWGPAVYAVVEGDDRATELADRARGVLDGAGVVHSGPFPATGARVSSCL